VKPTTGINPPSLLTRTLRPKRLKVLEFELMQGVHLGFGTGCPYNRTSLSIAEPFRCVLRICRDEEQRGVELERSSEEIQDGTACQKRPN
jgi:hypothetical protein